MEKRRRSTNLPISFTGPSYLAGFQVGWFKFMLCTVHIVYGKSVPNHPKRVAEVKLIADFLSRRADEAGSWSNNIILLGDFNIFHGASETMQAITGAGFLVPPELQSVPASNLGKKKRRYDQIAFKVRANHLKPHWPRWRIRSLQNRVSA